MPSLRKRKPRLTRNAAMTARPYPMPGIKTQTEDDQSIRITIHFQRSEWQKWFGAPPEYEKQFELDSLGSEVFRACDGKTSVGKIVERFAASHGLNAAEAEMAVARYMKTLMTKRIIGMALD